MVRMWVMLELLVTPFATFPPPQAAAVAVGVMTSDSALPPAVPHGTSPLPMPPRPMPPAGSCR